MPPGTGWTMRCSSTLDIQDGLNKLFNLNKPHFVVWAWIYDTISEISLGTAFGDALRLLRRPLNGGVFRDFWDAGVTKHS
jgi:hypothetical protein